MQTQGVSITDLVKTYGDTYALAGLNLVAHPGEILGVAGPNGAGKSTMVKILAGEAVQDSGEITLDGVRWNLDTEAHRVAIVHQEPQLFPNLTVAENILVGVEGTRSRWPKSSASNEAVLREVGLAQYAHVPVGELPLALAQRTEIARALAKSADVFLFDEPNSALTEAESAELFDRMHALANRGKIIILVSHRLTELATNCDRVIIIVDGRARTELRPPELDEERIARELVVGRSDSEVAVRASRVLSAETLLTVSGWTHRKRRFTDLDVTLGVAEILAVVGVEGSGGRELVRSVAGFEPTSGSISLGPLSAGAAQRAVAYVTGDRVDSLFDNLSVGENLYLRSARKVTGRSGSLKVKGADAIAADARRRFLVKAQSLKSEIRSLSGGNQQKVAIAAALALQPPLVALEEPTRGVDLTSKAEIYRLLREYSNTGAGVIMYCTEDSEVFDAADRVIVMSRGSITGSLMVADYSDAEGLAAAIATLSGNDALRSAAAGDPGILHRVQEQISSTEKE